MQAYSQTPSVELRLSAAQPASCSRLLSSIAQAPFYIQQQMMSNQQNNLQSSSQPVSNSSNLQSRQMPHNGLVGLVASLPAATVGTLPQNFNHYPSHQTFFSNTVPQQNYAMLMNNASSNVFCVASNNGNASSMVPQSILCLNGQQNGVHFAQQTAAEPQPDDLTVQAKAPQIIRSNQGQTSGGHTNSASYSTVTQYSAGLQRPSVSSQSSNNSCQTFQSHSIYNGNQVQHSSQIQHESSPYRIDNNANSYCHLQQNKKMHPSLTSNQFSPPTYIGQHFVIQNQNQRINQSVDSGLRRDSVQPQNPLQQWNTVPIFGHHSRPIHPTVPAFTANTQQLNGTTTRLQMSSQVAVSSSSPTSEAPPPIPKESTFAYSKVRLRDLFLDGKQLPSQRHGTSPQPCHKASFTAQGQQPSYNSTKGSYYEKQKSASNCSAPATLGKEIHLVSEHLTPVQRTATLKENVQVHNGQLKPPYVQSSVGLHTDTNTEREIKNKHNYGHWEVQYSEDMAETLELIMALQKVHQQSHKVVAVIPPISQQVPSPGKKEVTTSSDDSLPFKIDAVGTLVRDCENVEHMSNALNLPKETIKELQQLLSVPYPETQDCKKHEDGSTVHSQIPNIQSTDIPQSKTDSSTPEETGHSTVLTLNTPENLIKDKTGQSDSNTIDLQQRQFSVPHPETQDCKKNYYRSTVGSRISDAESTDIPPSNTDASQRYDCSTASTSIPAKDHSNDETGQSNCDMVDLSRLQVYNFTPKKLNDWVTVLESKVKVKPVADVKKCLVNLYFDGNQNNMNKQLDTFTAEMPDFFSKVSIKDVQSAKFEYIHPKDLKRLAHGHHILENDTILPTEEFRSSWLNVDGPADIENVLAEPDSDLNYTDYVLEAGFNTLPLTISSESELSTEVIPAASDEQNVTTINKEHANLQVCQSNSVHQTFSTQEVSEKHEDKKVEEPQEQNGHLISEESEGTNETVGALSENKRTEGDQACRDDEEIFSSPEIIEQSPNKDDSRSDSDSMELSLLSFNDVRTIFKELPGGNLQKDLSQLCQDKTNVSAMVDLGTPNELCNSGNQIKFTCPHVTDFDWDGKHFCPKCWEETPVLNLDLEEALVSPEDGPTTPTQGHQDQSCRPVSGSPYSSCIVLSESNSITASPNPQRDSFEGTVLEPDHNPGESYTSLSGKSPVEESHDSLSFTMVLEKQVSETTDSVGIALPEALSDAQNIVNAFMSVQTKSPGDDVSPPENHLRTKSKSAKRPMEDDEKASCKRTHHGYSSVTPTKDDQNRERKRKERGAAQNNSSQSGKPDTTANVNSVLRGNSTTPSTCRERSSSLSVTSPGKEAHGQEYSESLKSSMPVEEQVRKADRLMTRKKKSGKKKPVAPSQPKALRRKIPPPSYPSCKKVKVSKIILDDLFAPDITVKKANSPKSHPRVADDTPTKDRRHPFSKDKGGEKPEEKRSPTALTIRRNSHSSQPKTDAAVKLKTSFDDNERKPGYTKQAGQKEMEKRKFALYGSNTGTQNNMHQHECCSRSKLSIAPVYITVLDSDETAPRYTDTVSAKQKVYTQWSSTFVATETKTSSHKKRQKNVKELLDSKMEALRRLIKDRTALRNKQIQS